MRAVGWVFVILGVIGIPVAFYLQSQANHQAEVDSLTRTLSGMGNFAGHSGSAAPWVVGIGSAVLLLVGIVLLAVDHSFTQARAQSSTS